MKLLKNPRPDAGFTLIEVLAVVVIVAVLMAISAPGWLGFLNRQRVGAVRNDLLQTMRTTQQTAVQRRMATTIAIDANASSPLLLINNLSQSLGSDTDNPGNIRLEMFSVVNGARTNIDRIVFNYQGMIARPEDLPGQIGYQPPVLPVVVNVTSTDSGTSQCVIVMSILGTMKTAQGNECLNPNIATSVF